MFSKYSWLLLLFVTCCVLYMCDYYKRFDWDFVREGYDLVNLIYVGLVGNSLKHSDEVNTGQRIFTSNELKKYTNLENGLYLSILGQVYDVTKGAKHYGPGETYHAFTGRDASLAFITGEFTAEGLIDDISSLSPRQTKTLDDWAQFYKKNYIYKGRLKGRYYNGDGSPTIESYKVQEKLARVTKENIEEEHWKMMFPPCNMEWKPETGTRIWCSKRSGGIQRDWIGVPRMLFESPGSENHRCACVNLDSMEYKEKKGSLREYIDCPKNSAQCYVKIDSS